MNVTGGDACNIAGLALVNKKDLEAKLDKAVEALKWVTHLINGVGKSGESPEPKEWEEANKQAQQVLSEIEGKP